MKRIRIGHLYGNLLNTYGDNGNLLMLQYIAKQKGYETESQVISIGDHFDPDAYDLVFFGGGQDYEQKVISKQIHEIHDGIQSYIENKGVLLAICGGYQLLGHYYVNTAGEKLPGLGVLDHYTERQINHRFTGDVTIYSEYFQQELYGFENHNGVTHLGSQVKPFGKVLNGYGNNGQDQTEGAHYLNTFCSYFHGPLLVRNTWLADKLIDLTLKQLQEK
ncbi:adenosylcobyric acid synthase [Facklamia sp. DSM 111018]|uniref:Lipid II isoglutaminyl synthase (glutamine-hydrolyzing) subunit GatD n=1 Tax=Facklamia lactis TaxID=2749967 RepID=A0ABS0LQX8_9LACT|nr:adenosylcobyric acid synthase [Facklamia lactis]MBG9985699.1 adenosylcobyric acid synthase [Facklamia lactis]